VVIVEEDLVLRAHKRRLHNSSAPKFGEDAWGGYNCGAKNIGYVLGDGYDSHRNYIHDLGHLHENHNTRDDDNKPRM